MGSRNLAFALVRAPGYVVQRMGVIDLQQHAARQATDSLVDTLTDPDQNAWMLCLDPATTHVVVELQPGSGVCKTLSHVLQTMFRMKDRQFFFRFMPAGNKLKFNPELRQQVMPETYGQRKACAVEMARRIFAEQPSNAFGAFFEEQGYKQKTDLADAVVQACRHLQEENVGV